MAAAATSWRTTTRRAPACTCDPARGLTNYLNAVAMVGGAGWTSVADLEPYLAAGSVTRQFADAAGGTFVPA